MHAHAGFLFIFSLSLSATLRRVGDVQRRKKRGKKVTIIAVTWSVVSAASEHGIHRRCGKKERAKKGREKKKEGERLVSPRRRAGRAAKASHAEFPAYPFSSHGRPALGRRAQAAAVFLLKEREREREDNKSTRKVHTHTEKEGAAIVGKCARLFRKKKE